MGTGPDSPDTAETNPWAYPADSQGKSVLYIVGVDASAQIPWNQSNPAFVELYNQNAGDMSVYILGDPKPFVVPPSNHPSRDYDIPSGL